jgi:menaquinone-specific isochorismate synthase
MTSVPSAAPRLHARTELLDAEPDLLRELGAGGFAWFGPNGSFVTGGEAVRVAPADARAVLDAIDDVRPDGAPRAAGAIAVGALPFDGGGRLVVPARVVGVGPGGRAWRTTIGPADETRATVREVTATPTVWAATSRPARAEWSAMVLDAVARIRAGALRKVVLAREVTVEADAPFDVAVVLARLLAAQPGGTVYADGGFVGASPEVLVRRFDEAVTSVPMAGTIGRAETPRDDDAAVARLVASPKEALEHRLVVDAVRDVLAARCDAVRVRGPVPVRLPTVTHLATTVDGTLRDGATSALDLALALHPTPAVGGTPRAAALALIAALEPAPRGRYGGPVGWVDARGDGEFVVALRCAALEGSTARLHAGAGIVERSDPAEEWAETEAKLAPMRRALSPAASVRRMTPQGT